MQSFETKTGLRGVVFESDLEIAIMYKLLNKSGDVKDAILEDNETNETVNDWISSADLWRLRKIDMEMFLSVERLVDGDAQVQ